jgi:hypothetical protein
VVEEFSIQSALIVASHRAQTTEVIITTDGEMGDADYQTVWE